MTAHDDMDPGGNSAGVHIGSVSASALNIGDHGSATNTNHHGNGARDPGQEELRRLIAELRSDLGRFVATPQSEALDTELADAEREITTAGAAGPGRLERVRDAITLAGSAAASLASGVAVAQAVATLLGG